MRFVRWRLRVALCAWMLAGSCVTGLAAENGRALLLRCEPEYSGLAKQMRLQGEVMLHVWVEPDRSIREVNVQSGHPILAVAATNAVRRWKYSPWPERTTLEVRFVFQGQ